MIKRIFCQGWVGLIWILITSSIQAQKTKIEDYLKVFEGHPYYVDFKEKRCISDTRSSSKYFGADLVNIGCILNVSSIGEGLIFDCRKSERGNLGYHIMAASISTCKDVLKNMNQDDLENGELNIKLSVLFDAYPVYVNFTRKACIMTKLPPRKSKFLGQELLEIGCTIKYILKKQALVFDCQNTDKGNLYYQIMTSNKASCEDVLIHTFPHLAQGAISSF